MPDPILSIAPASAVEFEYITFFVTLSEPVLDAATVEYQVLSGSAERNDDVVNGTSPMNGVLTFAPGADSATIVLRADWESTDELDENFVLRLFNADGVSLGANVHSLTTVGWVLDNDGPGLNRALAVSAPVVTEAAGGKAIFTVSLSEAFDTDRSFSYQTHDGTAKAGSDYTARSGTVTFLAGQTTATIEVDLRNDSVAELSERFGLSITGAHNVTGATALAEIVDTDGALPVISVEGTAATEFEYMIYTIRLSEPALDAVTVDYNTLSGSGERNGAVVSGTNALSGQVTFAPGETTKTISLRASWESVDELDESVMLQLFNPVGATFGGNIHTQTAIGWALDNDGPGNNRAMDVSDIVVTEAAGGKAIFTVSLSEAFDTDRSFTFTTQNGSAKAGSDYAAKSGSVTFRAGQTEATVEVNLANNSVAEIGERFDLVVNGAHGVGGATGTALILDDDGGAPIISIESSTAVEFDYVVHTVRLSKPAADAVTVGYTTLAGSAVPGADVYAGTSPLTGTVTFAPGQTTQQITLRASWDSTDQLDRSYFVRLQDPSGATFAGGNRSISATGWVLDNDGPGLNRTVAVSGAEVREGPGGRVAVFAVEISTAATSDVTLRYQTVEGSARAGSDFSARSGNITFKPGQTRVEIEVPILNDLILEGNEQFLLRVVPPFPGTLSSSATTAIGTATILDGTIRGTAADNTLIGTSVADRIEGLGGNDVIFGQAGNDLLSGGTQNDRIYGQGDNDRLFGGDGADLLDGGAGRDTMAGGTGNDRYVVDPTDVIVESANAGIDLVIASHSRTLGSDFENLALQGGANLNGTGNALANSITGNTGNNVLTGLGGNDLMSGLSGNDRLLGGDGNDLLNGGAGRDTLVGGRGDDRYVIDASDVIVEAANGGIDRLFASHSVRLAAGIEDLTLTGTAGVSGTGNGAANGINGNGGNNRLSGAGGNDRLAGLAGNDRLLGGGGNDLLDGSLGQDFMRGGGGRDTMRGGSGSDTLAGDGGTDLLYAGLDGATRDVFVFRKEGHSDTGSGRDRIYEFRSGSDEIDLRGIDANRGQSGNQSFDFNGGRADDYSVWVVRQGGNSIVRADNDGDGRADLEILIAGVTRLGEGDFLL
ncbi:Calx-beta domain-containing protein [Paracoccus spongiarum]|uniref:Calx-beta domain-containing protein n=1 Tax=Paracoccus spongiarum TaxID=3064387 RepID=A0ABT9JCJ5_9RHOB|nr:Calx-beta domain-containing protein [Paracoccus sp. 2205BS29-5]MDP5307526.1 Calx-beta domain-containing protein [Paracoccus sp. 2205BS29-5]